MPPAAATHGSSDDLPADLDTLTRRALAFARGDGGAAVTVGVPTVLLRTKGTKKYLKICMRRVRRYHNAVYCEQFSYIPSSHEDGFSFCSLTMLAPCALAAPAVLCMIHAYPLIDLAFLTLSLDFAFNCCLDTYAQNQGVRILPGISLFYIYKFRDPFLPDAKTFPLHFSRTSFPSGFCQSPLAFSSKRFGNSPSQAGWRC